MSFKSGVTDRVAGMVDRIEQQVEDLPHRVRDTQETLAEWRHVARRFVRDNPGKALIGAFAIGFLLAKAARRA